MGQRILLEGASFTNPKFPIIRDDKSLTPGSLMMFDPSHTMSGLSGVPVDGQLLYNLAWKEASQLIGSGDSESLRSPFRNSLGAHGRFELTTKGGLYGIVSQVTKTSQNAKIQLATAVGNYLTANPTRQYATFFWGRLTRLRKVDDVREVLISVSPNPLQNNLINGWFNNATGNQRLSFNRPTGWVGTPVGGSFLSSVPAWGGADAYTHVNQLNSSSFIIYRVHIVDILASGKTFTQLDAEDAALYAQMFGVGGKFYGDTFADPSILP